MEREIIASDSVPALCGERESRKRNEGMETPARKMGNGNIQCLQALSRQSPSATVINSRGQHHRQNNILLLHNLADGIQGSLGIQSIEYRLHQQQIHPAVNQSPRLLGIRGSKRIEIHRTILRTVNIRRKRQCPGSRSHTACHINDTPFTRLIRLLPCNPRPLKIQTVNPSFQPVFLL